MRKNIIVISSAILGLTLFTWLCVRFINNDKIPKKDDEAVTNTEKLKGTKTEKLELNGKENNIRFNLVQKSIKDKKNDKEYFREAIVYKIFINETEIQNLNIEDNPQETGDNIEINEYVKAIKGIDEKDYLIIKLITNDKEKNVFENILIFDNNNEIIFRYVTGISNEKYEVVGNDSNNYIIASNNCDGLNTEEATCNEQDKVYSTYVINEDNINFLECYDPKNFDGRVKEKLLTIEKNKVTIKNSDNKYTVSATNLDKVKTICPEYKNLSK